MILNSAQRRRSAFTLIEVLVVVAIIALLIAILLPSLSRARAQARTTVCTTQIRQLMAASLMYANDFKGRLPGSGVSDKNLVGEFLSGNRKDYLSWLGMWTVVIPYSQLLTNPTNKQLWDNVPRMGRLWRYYQDEKLLKCPAAIKFNGKFSYSIPENMAVAVRDPSGIRDGFPPMGDQVKHPSSALYFLDEDEESGLSTYSVDDGFGEPDVFADRHLGQATVSFFDGHSEAHYFPRGPGTTSDSLAGKPVIHYARNKSPEPFRAWMIQIAPFNSRYTPRPWAWDGRYASYPKFKKDNNKPGCGRAVGCE